MGVLRQSVKPLGICLASHHTQDAAGLHFTIVVAAPIAGLPRPVPDYSTCATIGVTINVPGACTPACFVTIDPRTAEIPESGLGTLKQFSISLALLCMVSLPGSYDCTAQTTIVGEDLAFKSSGDNSGSDWMLSDNGYVGTYITLAAPGEVEISAQAAGIVDGGVAPRMNFVLADASAGFDIAEGFNTYSHTFDLPAGTYFLRTEFSNDTPNANRQLAVRNLTITGATVSNTGSQSTNNANALAAADTYIDHFRRGRAVLNLVGATPGTEVHVALKKHDFLFGTAVGGFNLSSPGDQWLVPTTNTNSDAYKLQQAIKANFNAIVPANAGKWQQNEFSRDSLFFPVLQRMFDFAENNDLRMRMHNLIWDQQQPGWVNTLLNNAQSANPTIAANAKAELRQEISERIAYYIGDGIGSDWSDFYEEVDIHNEFDHEPRYLSIFGADGLADIYNEAAAAVAATGNSVKLFANEYNVLQWGDPYGNWYRQHIEDLENAGGQVDGIGIQYYVDNRTFEIGSNQHNAWRIMQILQNLSVTGKDLALTEFGVNSGASEQLAARFLEETVRLVFGNANSTGFTMWGFWEPDTFRPAASFYTADWQERLPLHTWQALMNEWTTDELLTVGPDGTVDFTGFFGEYEVTIDGETFTLDLVKGLEDYSLLVAVPGDFNGDLKVDGADLAIWHGGYGMDASGDADGDGDTDGRDFLVWQRNYNPIGAFAATNAVPEPATLLLVALLITLGWPRQLVE